MEIVTMTDRCAVITTLNGEMVEYRVFDRPAQAMQHYNSGVGKLQEMVKHTDEEGVWEIMLCDIKQYAISRQNAEYLDTRESEDWYSKYFEIMATPARKLSSASKRYSPHLWRRLKNSVNNIMTDDEKPIARRH
ncbi:MAG: hypothetical protein ACM3L5_00820 [Candidatus Saccharibacteria bacterium]